MVIGLLHIFSEKKWKKKTFQPHPITVTWHVTRTTHKIVITRDFRSSSPGGRYVQAAFLTLAMQFIFVKLYSCIHVEVAAGDPP